ncbi:MAG: NAD(P)H-hydrate dehydratase [Bacteroidetes bacterium]|nr:NAD(P)H-hydrate dehydratase [Bacteroidota bacterium]
MKILSQEQQRQADMHTISREPISSLDLMERAAHRWLEAAWPYLPSGPVAVLSGFGNNGGDALAIARLLHLHGVETKVFMACFGRHLSPDCKTNLERLPSAIPIIWISEMGDMEGHVPFLASASLIDGLFGSGLRGSLTEPFAGLVQMVKKIRPYTLAIDIPSGMLAHRPITPGAPVIPADWALTFQSPKLAFFYPEHEGLIGNFRVIDIGLDKEYIHTAPAGEHMLEKEELAALMPSRPKFSHKGQYGKVGVLLGHWKTHGAAVLAAISAQHMGAGKVYVISPEPIDINISWPGMMLAAPEDDLGSMVHCIGPGMGTSKLALSGMRDIIKKAQLPMVVDADAINVLSDNNNIIETLHPFSVLTPHMGEAKRLLGHWENTLELHQKARNFARAHTLILVLKGAHTAVVEPNGHIHFNTTGNPGLAKAGSGDVLSGVIAGLMAQGLDPADASKVGVYLHGLAADCYMDTGAAQAMTPVSLSQTLGKALQVLIGT